MKVCRIMPWLVCLSPTDPMQVGFALSAAPKAAPVQLPTVVLCRQFRPEPPPPTAGLGGPSPHITLRGGLYDPALPRPLLHLFQPPLPFPTSAPAAGRAEEEAVAVAMGVAVVVVCANLLAVAARTLEALVQ